MNGFNFATSSHIPDHTVFFGSLPESENAMRQPYRLTQKE